MVKNYSISYFYILILEVSLFSGHKYDYIASPMQCPVKITYLSILLFFQRKYFLIVITVILHALDFRLKSMATPTEIFTQTVLLLNVSMLSYSPVSQIEWSTNTQNEYK